MKHLKKVMALVIAMVMVLATTISAFAAEGDITKETTKNDQANFSIKLSKVENDTETHQYEAYQIFKADITQEFKEDASGNKVLQPANTTLTNITWGSAFADDASGDAFLAAVNALASASTPDNVYKTAINAIRAAKGTGYESWLPSTASELAEVFGNAAITDATALADVIGTLNSGKNGFEYLDGTKTDLTYDDTTEQYIAENITPGYYFVADKPGTLEDNTDTSAYTKYILQVVQDVEMEPKTSVPSINKTVKNQDELVEAYRESNDVAIGDQVDYEIIAPIPEMKDYVAKEQYYFVVNDTMSAGLSYKAQSLVIYLYRPSIDGTYYKIKTEDGYSYTTVAPTAATLAQYYEYDATAAEPYTAATLPKYARDTLSRNASGSVGTYVDTIKCNNNEIQTTSSQETINALEGNPTTFEIAFNDFYKYAIMGTAPNTVDYAGYDIVINYSAFLNNEAIIGQNGNPNVVDLTYSNNPNFKGEGTNKPGENDDHVVGKTPESKVITYTTKLTLYKKDGNNQKLSDVEFTLVGYQLNDLDQASFEYVESYVADANGEYWQLKPVNGTAADAFRYTKTDPTTLAEGSAARSEYTDENTKYKFTVTKTLKANQVSKSGTDAKLVELKGTTDATDGKIEFGSLAAGIYTLTEVKTVDGYTLLAGPIQITVEAHDKDKEDDINTQAGTEDNCQWLVYADDNTLVDSGMTFNSDKTAVEQGTKDGVVDNDVDEILSATNGIYEITVVNLQGTTLPSTGGIGTTIFYVLGTVLIIGASVLLITKRRMSAH